MKKTMMTVVLGAALFTITHRADAEPLARGYATVGGDIGGAVGAFSEGVSIGGGYRIAESPVYLHAQLSRGSFEDLSEAIGDGDTFFQGSGTYDQARAGVESQTCTRGGILCGVYGVDVGALRSSATTGPYTDTPSSRYTQEQLIPRAGADIGGEHLRLRTMAELSIGESQRDSMTPGMSTSTFGSQGFKLGAAVLYRF